jgi:F0F1-type ATP synthase assembly protein I
MVQGLFEDENEFDAERAASGDAENAENGSSFTPLPYTPDSIAETSRKSGLAFSAGIAFFGSIVFMLLLGWFVDLWLGSSPWGIVLGIVLGSVIGFVQFFRLSSQILGKTSGPSEQPLFRDDDKD